MILFLDNKGKKRKLDVRDVFNNEEDDINMGDGGMGGGGLHRRRPLVPLDYGDVPVSKGILILLYFL